MKERLAGFLDGDGCIGIYRVKRSRSRSWHYVLHCVFGQSRGDNMKILRDINKTYGGYLYKIPKKKYCHQAWALRLAGWGAIKLIKDVLPYMRVREKQARLAMKFMRYRKQNNGQRMGRQRLSIIHLDFYENCRQKMKWYNRRGTRA